VAEHDFTEELTNRVLNTVDTVVATVNDKAVRPAVLIARGIVFGAIIAVVALAVVILLAVGLLRLITIGTGHVWISYLALSALFCGVGAYLYSKRGAAPNSDG
jgi:hypothetical protein